MTYNKGMKKILLIGGGSGVAELLAELKKDKKLKVSAIISTFDSGGSTGRLREKLGIPAVGDLRKVFSAGSEKAIASLLEKRLDNSHTIGNLILAYLVKTNGFEKAIKIYRELTSANSEIIPVSLDSADLIGVLENGQQIRSEAKFDSPPKKLTKLRVKSLRLTPQPKLNPDVAKALRSADLIIVGPGSLFGSLLAHFAVPNFRETFKKSKAKKILVLNATREFGCRGESLGEIITRFPVKFDVVLKAKKNVGRWNPKLLIKKIFGNQK